MQGENGSDGIPGLSATVRWLSNDGIQKNRAHFLTGPKNFRTEQMVPLSPELGEGVSLIPAMLCKRNAGS
jgi:hypothetical protein